MYSLKYIMTNLNPKRPISASICREEASRYDLYSPKERVQEQYHSENLNHSEKSSAQKKLPLLLLKLKLEELGFRTHQYSQYIQDIEQLRINTVTANALEIVNAILSQHLITSQSTMAKSSSGPISSLKVQQAQHVSQSKTICSVCLQEFGDENLYKLNCEHSFCKPCLAEHIKNSINEAKYQIECMEVECATMIGDSAIKALIDEAMYKRYHYFKRKKELQGNPNNKFCSVPNCQGILEEKDDIHLCPECKAEYCVTCSRARHEGDCSSRIQQMIDRSYQDYNIKKCPNCRAPIQKMDGCNHMTCKNCSYQFCWLCLRKYSKYHYRYFNCCGCPGMQFQDEENRHCQRFKQFCVFLILPALLTLIVGTVIALLPFYMLTMMFIKPVQKAMEFSCLSHCCQCSCSGCTVCDDEDLGCCTGCCAEIEVNVAHVGIGLLMLPYGVLYAIFVAPIKYFVHVYEFALQMLE